MNASRGFKQWLRDQRKYAKAVRLDIAKEHERGLLSRAMADELISEWNRSLAANSNALRSYRGQHLDHKWYVGFLARRDQDDAAEHATGDLSRRDYVRGIEYDAANGVGMNEQGELVFDY
jgi:hypothetical protein